MPEGFAEFYACYPRKASKQDAVRAWSKLAPDATLREQIHAALLLHTQLPQWRKDNGEFIPYPATWLNGRRWEDQVQPDESGEPGGSVAFDPVAIELPPWLDLHRDVWRLWCAERAGAGKSLTLAAAHEQVKSLHRRHTRGLDALQSIRDSINSGWPGLYEPRPPGGSRRAPVSDGTRNARVKDVMAGIGGRTDGTARTSPAGFAGYRVLGAGRLHGLPGKLAPRRTVAARGSFLPARSQAAVALPVPPCIGGAADRRAGDGRGSAGHRPTRRRGRHGILGRPRGNRVAEHRPPCPAPG